jgi:short-subunit dehydrogenase
VIGLEIAKELLLNNIFVLLGSRQLSKGQITSKSIKGETGERGEPIELDVTEFANIERIAKTVKDKFG